MGFVMAVEKLMDVEVPERPSTSGSSWPSCSASPATCSGSAPSPWTWARPPPSSTRSRERESLLDIFQKLTGARMLYNYLRIGGVRNDLYDGFDRGVQRFLDDFEEG